MPGLLRAVGRTAVVAEELGLSIGLVEALIQYGEMEPTDTSEESCPFGNEA